MAFNLKLSDERGKQLQMIAEAESKSVVDVITDHIRSRVAAGVITADLPHIRVEKTGAGVMIKLRGFTASVSADDVPAFIAALRAAGVKASPTEGARKLAERFGFGDVSMKRMGAGVKLVSATSGDQYPMPFSVAADLADQINRAAK